MGILSPGVEVSIAGSATAPGTPAASAAGMEMVGGADVTGTTRRLLIDASGEVMLSDYGSLVESQCLILGELRVISRLLHQGMSIPDDLDVIRAEILSTIIIL